jgi:hypothetical protein
MSKLNCVVRTYRNGYTKTTEHLAEKLNQGWIVKSSTPLIDSKGQTECVEYILEKEINS